MGVLSLTVDTEWADTTLDSSGAYRLGSHKSCSHPIITSNSVWSVIYSLVSLLFRKKNYLCRNQINKTYVYKTSLILNAQSYDVRLFNNCFWNFCWPESLLKVVFSWWMTLRMLMNNPSDNIILELMVKTEKRPIAEKKWPLTFRSHQWKCLSIGDSI